MPTYLYEHTEDACALGKEFDYVQPMRDDKLSTCPDCGHPVRRLVSPGVGVSTPRSNSQLKDLGFTKLVKRDKGVYENVTARNGEERYFDANKPESAPDFSKTIPD